GAHFYFVFTGCYMKFNQREPPFVLFGFAEGDFVIMVGKCFAKSRIFKTPRARMHQGLFKLRDGNIAYNVFSCNVFTHSTGPVSSAVPLEIIPPYVILVVIPHISETRNKNSVGPSAVNVFILEAIEHSPGSHPVMIHKIMS